MPRNMRADEHRKRTIARRQHALDRMELRRPSTPRAPALSPTSQAVKVMDPESRAAIDAFLAKRGGPK